jgi:hypothetical protein
LSSVLPQQVASGRADPDPFSLSSEKAEPDNSGIPCALARHPVNSPIWVRAMRRPATALMLGWLLWVEMENPETHVWFRVDRKEFATYHACELERNGIIAVGQREGAGISFMMSRPDGVGNTFVVNGDRVRISVCMRTSPQNL